MPIEIRTFHRYYPLMFPMGSEATLYSINIHAGYVTYSAWLWILQQFFNGNLVPSWLGWKTIPEGADLVTTKISLIIIVFGPAFTDSLYDLMSACGDEENDAANLDQTKITLRASPPPRRQSNLTHLRRRIMRDVFVLLLLSLPQLADLSLLKDYTTLPLPSALFHVFWEYRHE